MPCSKEFCIIITQSISATHHQASQILQLREANLHKASCECLKDLGGGICVHVHWNSSDEQHCPNPYFSHCILGKK